MSRGFNGLQMNPYTLIPPAIKILIFTNVAISLINWLVLPLFSYNGAQLSSYFSVFFSAMPFGSEYFYPYWQLITYQFLHGGFTHLLFNMLALWMFGVELEQLWGSWRFILFYLLCGVGGGVLHLLVSDSPTVGASGAIMGILVAFGMTYPDREIMMFPFFIPIKAKYFVMIYAAIDLISGLSAAQSGIAHFAHLGGAIVGVLLVKFGSNIGFDTLVEKISNKTPKPQSYSVPQRKDERYVTFKESTTVVSQSSVQKLGHIGTFYMAGEPITQDMVDAILDKISEKGMSTLTDKEQHILQEVAKRMS